MPEGIIETARSEIHPDDLRADDLLDEIYHQRDLSRQARQQAEQARQEAEALRLELLTRLEKIEDERRDIMETARQDAAAEMQKLQEELASIRRTLARLRQPAEALGEVEEQVAEIEERLVTPVERISAPIGPELSKLEQARRRAIRLGDKVRLRSLGAQGIVTSLGAEEAEVQVGVLRVRSRLSDLELPTPSGATSAGSDLTSPAREGIKLKTEKKKTPLALPESPGMELDLRGQRAEEALATLDRYLDAAFLAGLPFVRIIHGKGTGKLREVIRKELKDHPHIKSFEAGKEQEGGEGVTVVKLAVS
jgi:DNA mismatch repair protein MutS2